MYAKSARVGNPIQPILTQGCPTAAPRAAWIPPKPHGLGGVRKGSRASFKTCQHAEKGRLGSTWADQGTRLDRGRYWKGGESGSVSAPTAAHLRGTLTETRRLWAQGLGAPCAAGSGSKGAAGASFPCSTSPGGRGRGHHLTARTNFSPLGGAHGSGRPGEHRAQLSPNGEVCKQKRAPRGSPGGRWAARRDSIPAAQPAIVRGDPRTDLWTPHPGQSLSARLQNAALNAPSLVGRGSSAQRADTPGSPPRGSGPEQGTDRQGEHPVSVAETPGLEVPRSETEIHTATRTHTHTLPEVDKNQPTDTKCRGRRRKSALTSRGQEDRMPPPGHCHFHSAPGTWTPLACLPP